MNRMELVEELEQFAKEYPYCQINIEFPIYLYNKYAKNNLEKYTGLSKLFVEYLGYLQGIENYNMKENEL